MPGAVYSGGRSGITPVTTTDNWTLEANAAGEIGMVGEFNWGGESTTSTAMRTRIVRPTTAGATATAGTAGTGHPGAQAARLVFATGWTTQPVIPADGTGELYVSSWNSHGGVIIWKASPGEEIFVVNGLLTSELSCRNAVGTGVSSYGVRWTEV